MARGSNKQHPGHRIEDTTKRPPLHQMVANMELDEDTRGCTADERHGQQQLLQSTTLPTKCYSKDEKFVALGFTLGEPLASDPLFREATLPTGWHREGSEHALWSYIVDERGIKRVAIFYKAAPWDRDAFMRLTSVGHDIVATAIFGAEVPSVRSLKLDKLAKEELDEVHAAVAEQRARVTDSPKHFGQYEPRVKLVERLLAEVVK